MRRSILRKKISIICGLFLVTVAAIGMFVIGRNNKEVLAADGDAETPIQTVTGQIFSEGWDTDPAYGTGTNLFKFKNIGNNNRAWCAQANKAIPAYHTDTGVAIYEVTTDSAVDWQTWYKVMYYGELEGKSNLIIHYALSHAYAGDAGSVSVVTNLNRDAKSYLNEVISKPLPDGRNYLYLAYNSDDVQTIMSYEHREIRYRDILINKKWIDFDNEYSLRPEFIRVRLYKDGVDTGETRILSDFNNWQASFMDLENDYEWTVVEDEVVNYNGDVVCEASYDVSNYKYESSCTITNTIKSASLSLPVEKRWVDNGNASNTRPEQIKVYLVIDGFRQDDKYVILNSDNGWKSSFEGLAIRHDYSVVEEAIEGYDSEVDCGNKCIITNKLSDHVSFKVFKIWDDHGEAENRPEFVIAKVTGSDGSEYSDILDADSDEFKYNPNNWVKTFGAYPKYDDNGREIEYTVAERLYDSPVEYVSEVSGNVEDGFTIKNTYDAKVNLLIEKLWLDNGNASPVTRPDSITVNILKTTNPLALDSEKEVYSTVTLTSDDLFVPSAQEVSQATSYQDRYYLTNRWVRSISDLPKYDDEDRRIYWSVSEPEIDGYSGEWSCDFVATDSDNRICRITNRRYDNVSVIVNKTWLDFSADERPEEVNFLVRQYVYDYGTGAEKPINFGMMKVKASDDWEGQMIQMTSNGREVNSLARYDEYGREYRYDVVEMNFGNYEGRLISETRDNDGNFLYTYQNVYSPTASIGIIKCWVDNNNAYNTRPESLRFTMTTEVLDKDTGEPIEGRTTTQNINLTSENEFWGCWMKQITGLPREDDDGNTYSYSVEEDQEWMSETDYVGSIKTCDASKNSWVCHFTNSLSDSEEVRGTKTWMDDNDRLGLRPEMSKFKVTLYRYTDNGERVVYDREPTWQQERDGKTWSYNFGGLPVYDDQGAKYHYYVVEDTDSMELANGDFYISNPTDSPLNLVNVLTGRMDYCGKKVWSDEGAPEGFRPEDITVSLNRSDGKIFTTTVSAVRSDEVVNLCGDIVEDENTWYFVFSELDKYDMDGVEFSYELSENSDIEGYVTKIAQDKHMIINELEEVPDTGDVRISKYVFMASGVLLGGFVVSRRILARR